MDRRGDAHRVDVVVDLGLVGVAHLLVGQPPDPEVAEDPPIMASRAAGS
jgi:hypothetical protein